MGAPTPISPTTSKDIRLLGNAREKGTPMTPYYTGHGATIHAGDCLDILRQLPDNSVDAVVTDPPYGLEFMGKEWDRFGGAPARFRSATESDAKTNGIARGSMPDAYRAGSPFQAWCTQWAAECLRVLKPGGHLLAFGGTRTWHRLACAVEDAGFEVRDSIAWQHQKHVFCQCSPPQGPQPAEQRPEQSGALAVEWIPQGGGAWPGCPRCRLPLAPPFEGGHLAWNYGSGFPKSLDVSKAIDKAAGATREVVGMTAGARNGNGQNIDYGAFGSSETGLRDITAPATPDAATWAGWGTALKPAFEPIVVARKPLTGTVASNVLAHGTGALNIDATRIEGAPSAGGATSGASALGQGSGWNAHANRATAIDRSMSAGRWPANVILDDHAAAELDAQSGESVSPPVGSVARTSGGQTVGTFDFAGRPPSPNGHGDTGGASRFYYTAKADATERPDVAGVRHPTVKPLDLMRWLVRLVTPPGGVVLEPFAGSGTTAEACLLEGFRCIAIEREADYLPLIVARITRQRDPVAHVRLTAKDDDTPTLFDAEEATA